MVDDIYFNKHLMDSTVPDENVKAKMKTDGTNDTHSHTDVIIIDERAPTTAEVNNYSEDEEAVDVWDELWVWDSMMDERQKTSLTAGFGVYSIAEVWEWQRQLNRKVKNDNILCCRLYCDPCRRSGTKAILI